MLSLLTPPREISWLDCSGKSFEEYFQGHSSLVQLPEDFSYGRILVTKASVYIHVRLEHTNDWISKDPGIEPRVLAYYRQILAHYIREADALQGNIVNGFLVIASFPRGFKNQLVQFIPLPGREWNCSLYNVIINPERREFLRQIPGYYTALDYRRNHVIRWGHDPGYVECYNEDGQLTED